MAVATASDESMALQTRPSGINHVLRPHHLGADEALALLAPAQRHRCSRAFGTLDLEGSERRERRYSRLDFLARQAVPGTGQQQDDLATISPFNVEADLPMIGRVLDGGQEKHNPKLAQLVCIGANGGEVSRHGHPEGQPLLRRSGAHSPDRAAKNLFEPQPRLAAIASCKLDRMAPNSAAPWVAHYSAPPFLPESGKILCWSD